MLRQSEVRKGVSAGLWPVDRLLLWAVASLAAAAAAFHPHPRPYLLLLGALAAFIVVVAWTGPRSRIADALHAFAPLVVIVSIFQTVGFVVAAANPARWDAFFALADARLFGPLVPAWRNAFGRPGWLTDALSIVYVSYYVVPTAMAAVLYA